MSGSHSVISIDGTVSPMSTYVVQLHSDVSCSGVTVDFTTPGSHGINENDRIRLLKNGIVVDDLSTPSYTGYILTRDVGSSVVAPSTASTSYPTDNWSTSSQDCSGLGAFSLPAGPVIDITSEPIDIKGCEVSMTVSSSTAGVTYNWRYNDPSSMAGWSDVNTANMNVGTVLGENTSTLNISGDVAALVNFQFYCEVIDGTCALATNAAQFEIDSKPIYRSISTASGNWSDYSNWEMSTDYMNYYTACTYPRDVNSVEVIIQDGTTIVYDLSGSEEITINKVTIEENGTLELLASSQLTINGGTTGADLIVEGTLYDRTNNSNSLSLTSGTTWKLASTGTVIKTNAGAVAFYRDQYEGGMSSIPGDASWIYRYNGDGNPSVGAVNFFYPNLAFENTTGSIYSWNTVGNLFNGSTGGHTEIKGNFDIGVSGNSGCVVGVVNFNTQPMLIYGDLFIDTDSKLINENSNSTVFGTGLELKGNLTVNGELDLLSGTTERIVKFSGSTDQSVSGSGTLNLYKVELDKTLGSLMVHRDLHIQNELVMKNSNVFLNGNLLELGRSITEKGILSYTNGLVFGRMRRWFKGTNSGNNLSLFPIGCNDSGLKNRNAKIEFTSIPSNGGYLTVEFVGSPMTNNGLPIFSDNSGGAGFDVTTAEDQGFWRIENETGKLTDGQYTITLTGEGFTTVNDLSKLTLLKRVVTNSPNWFCHGAHQSATGTIASPVVSRSGVLGWSNFGFGRGGSNNSLPVTLLSFKVECEESSEQVKVKWATGSELNSSKFIVEKSRDLINWTVISEVQAAGYSTHKIDYLEHDVNPFGGIAYYRLSQFDYNGDSEVFNVVSTACSFGENSILAYPNPSNGSFKIEISWNDKIAQTEFQLIDATGRIVGVEKLNLKEGIMQFYYNYSHLQSGVYMMVFPGVEFKPLRIVIE